MLSFFDLPEHSLVDLYFPIWTSYGHVNFDEKVWNGAKGSYTFGVRCCYVTEDF